MKYLIYHLLSFLFFCLFLLPITSNAQGVTTGSMSGLVKDDQGEPLPGATIQAVHTPSGTQYNMVTQPNGRYTISGMRTGGPYQVTVSFIGFEPKVFENISLRLGQRYVLNVEMDDEGIELDGVLIEGRKDPLLNDEKTGASTTISREAITTMPTLSRSVQDFTRLTPQSSGESFAGQDPKAINFSLDGSVFNNSFGLTGSIPGAPTESTPISLEAIEEIQVNIAPYDVTQGGFTGAAINAITRSGDNEMRGSAFVNNRNQRFVGTNARGSEVITEDFNVQQYGFRLGGPIIKNKLFFFISAESERRSDPNSPFIAAASGREGANVTRVQKSDMDELRGFLNNNFGYDPGEYEDYNLPTISDKFLIKLDYNISDNHKISARFNTLLSSRERPVARTSLGFGGRNQNLFSLNFQNSNYLLNDDIYSGIIELQSNFGGKFSNELRFGLTSNRNSRTWGGGDFPMVDILEGGRNYISFGTDLLSPNRGLDSDTWQIQNNFTAYLSNHTVTAGLNFEYFDFRYTFTPTFFGHYVYNSLDDFYRDVAGEEVELRRFQRQYSALPGGEIPTANTQAYIASAYVQDEINVTNNLKVTLGLRLDVPFYGQTAERNLAAENLDFRKPDGEPITIRTDRLPEPQFMWSPRLGFNWDVLGNRNFQVRGGTGLFSGRPIYINISNMVNTNGVLQGQIREDNTTNFPFNPDVNAYIPSNGGAPDTYDLAYIDPGFRNPQVWRSNIGIDKDLFGGLVGTFEAIYTQQVSDLLFYDSNLRPSTRNLSGPDDRPLYGFGDEENRLNQNITNAVVLDNTNQGYSYSLTFQLQKNFNNGLHAMAAYNYAVAKNMVDGNTQHFLSYENIASVRGSNYPELGFSLDDQRHRLISSIGYRKEYAKNLATSISLFYELRNQGVESYVYNTDINGDQIVGNDLLFVPTQAQLNEMQFEPLTVNGNTFSAADQRAAFNQFIEQDAHLRSRRGMYALRNGVQFPVVGRLDLSFMQEFFLDIKGKRNTIQVRADIFNFTNLINNNWGVGQIITNETPIGIINIDPVTNIPTYQLNPSNGALVSESFTRTANIGDVWQMQLGLRYIFN
ncbi:Carboxypeptidase regulatory-like domain-containing protein [Belliella buryatensis]|uniref:Carboxypeptidase regulatory-like domain-containing protein n=1 Tax=Belliella buryatensis TaxID=1500549 RepID=A0A239F4L0_9BACT|nr:carboxypeptidase regulatory-like domain-containing protein [Belliella buryatensis]SNS51183.1 Carboxypeptidase regulatory-like domain-containing protein [Belliella buryatensis]